MNKENITKLLIRFLKIRSNLVISVILFIWIFYTLFFIYRNISPIFINPDEISVDPSTIQQHLVNQPIKEKVFAALEEKTKTKAAPDGLDNPFR